MREAGHHLGLVDEHVDELLVVGEVRQDALDRQRPSRSPRRRVRLARNTSAMPPDGDSLEEAVGAESVRRSLPSAGVSARGAGGAARPPSRGSDRASSARAARSMTDRVSGRGLHLGLAAWNLTVRHAGGWSHGAGAAGGLSADSRKGCVSIGPRSRAPRRGPGRGNRSRPGIRRRASPGAHLAFQGQRRVQLEDRSASGSARGASLPRLHGFRSEVFQGKGLGLRRARARSSASEQAIEESARSSPSGSAGSASGSSLGESSAGERPRAQPGGSVESLGADRPPRQPRARSSMARRASRGAGLRPASARGDRGRVLRAGTSARAALRRGPGEGIEQGGHLLGRTTSASAATLRPARSCSGDLDA